ncbi:MAG: hypothetical protein EP347_04520 [Alphaproteobacteria bacterium]|nr:MAG: hypothetical protein EP347_04520 [Alphaproteobacteria bacterium]
MKKVLLALSVAAFAGFGSTAIADDYDLGAACAEAVAGNAELTDEQKSSGCECIVAGADDAMTAGFEAGSADPDNAESHWTEEGAALVAECFPTSAE